MDEDQLEDAVVESPPSPNDSIPLDVADHLAEELRDTEEAIALVTSGAFDEQARLNAQFEAVGVTENALPGPIQKPDALETNPLSMALADPCISPGPSMTELVRLQAEALLHPERKKRSSRDPSTQAFLLRDYHAVNRSRFLFSCADDPDGCAMNYGSAWHYAIPEVRSHGASSSSSSDGAVHGQIARNARGGSGSTDRTSHSGKAAAD